MKKTILAITLFVSTFYVGNAQSIFGKWKTIDDKTNKASSIVEIYKENGKAYAKILTLFDKEKKDNLCTECTGKDKNKPIVGLLIIKGLEKDGDEWNGGKILDPANGKKYKCYITLESKDKLKVRGYIGFALLGRTQYWYRVK